MKNLNKQIAKMTTLTVLC